MFPHFGVHRRRDHNGGSRRQQRGAEEVSCLAVRVVGEEIGGCRRHDHEIGLLPKRHVRHVRNTVKHLDRDTATTNRFPGGFSDKLQGRVGGDDRDLVSLGHQ